MINTKQWTEKKPPNSSSKKLAVIQKLWSQYSPKLPLKTTWVSNNGIEATKNVINFNANDNISSQAPELRDSFILQNDMGKSKIQKRYL